MSKKSKRPQNKKSKGPRPRSVLLNLTKRRLAQYLGGIATVASLVIGAYVFFPRISVLPDVRVNPGDRFSTPFVISNAGHLTIYDVSATCVMDRIVDANHNMFHVQVSSAGMNALRLRPEEAKTVDCPVKMLAPMLQQASVLIRVSFQPSLLRFKMVDQFRFDAVIESNGRIRWTR